MYSVMCTKMFLERVHSIKTEEGIITESDMEENDFDIMLHSNIVWMLSEYYELIRNPFGKSYYVIMMQPPAT